uniref:ADP-ribosylhydrolase ARH3 n=1 Tax=Acrobeloides nanus TaxID=290746 RepID=A0A914CT77_9BILA
MVEEEMKRIYGAFYGQIIGDALGVRYEGLDAKTAIEQMNYEKRQKRNSLVGAQILPILGSDPPFIRPGQFTDDSEMALCLARSCVAKQSYDKVDVACAYSYWLCITCPKTSGSTTEKALLSSISTISEKPLTSNWREELTVGQKRTIYEEISQNVQQLNTTSLSNGSLMRISPLAIAFRNSNVEELRVLATEDAKLTHAHPVAWDAAASYVIAMAALLKGRSKENAYDEALNSAQTDIVRDLLHDAKTHALPVKLPQDITWENSIQPPKLTNGADISFQSAFYELLHAESFSSGLENSIARGGDTDTNGCIAGALLGARFGLDDIPEEWIEAVKNADPCKLSWDNVRDKIDIDFLSIQDVDILIPQLSNVNQF